MSKWFKRLAHSLHACRYHVVFCPKYRYRILKDEIAEYVRQQIYQLLGQKEGVEVLELNVQEDYVHLLLSNAAKVRSIRNDGLPERETGVTNVRTVSATWVEILGETSVVPPVLRAYGWDR